MSREIAERAFSNEVITPGVTTLADVAWWMREQQFENNLGTSFGMPSVYITGPDGFVALSNDHVIERGDFLAMSYANKQRVIEYYSQLIECMADR